MSRQSTKNKKYALRKIGKVFGSCVVATVITLAGAAIMAPSVTVYASGNESGGQPVTDISAASEGYEVRVPKGKKYVRNDEIESHTPVLKETGHDGRSFILKAEPKDDDPELTENNIFGYFYDNPMEGLFKKLYDEDEDGVIDDKYKRADADTINEHAGEDLNDPNIPDLKEPRVSEIDPKYPHRVDAGLTNITNIYDKNNDGKPDGADGEIDDQDTIVEANKPITADPKAEENVVKEDGTVVLSKYYRIHVNEEDTADKVDDIYEVGTKPKVERTPIPFETTYKRDDSVPEGTEEEVTAGVNGETVKTTTYELNVTTGEVTPNEPTTATTNPTTRVVKRGTQPKVERTPIPFETTYERDDSIPEGEERETTAGVPGEKVTTTTYEVNPKTGEVTANEPTSETTNPVTRVVKRGTQPKVERTPIPFETTYERDDSIPEGEEREVTAGKNGETVKTTTYELNPTTGEVTANEPTTATTNPVTRVVKRGTQPKVEKTPIPFETTYERDDSIPKGEERETTAGVNGEKVTTTTYEVNPKTGDVTANTPTSETTNPVTRVVKRGTQPKVERTEIPFETTYERDDSVPEGTEEEVTAGKNGETVKTTTYELNPTTGEVTANEPTSVTTNAVTRVVKKGTQPKVEKTPIPFETRYERDDSIPEGEEREVTAGVNGETVKTTTYELNPTTGEVTANEPTSETTNPVTRVVKRGTQPKVEKTPIPFETRYERDDSIPEGEEREVTAGVNGETVKTTTYELNPTTGEVTANEPTSETTNPVTRVVKRGTQPKVEKTPIPFETRYERDDSIPEGEEREVTAGVNGETVKTTTYELNPTTGEVTANEPTRETTNPVTRVVKRGTQPKPGDKPETPKPKPGQPTTPYGAPTQPVQPGETPETPQPKPGETPETPQPKPGETPETPKPKPEGTPVQPAQPGEPTKPSGTPVQPAQPGEPTKPDGTPVKPEDALNVLPPTPRIVERPGGNTVEVGVPTKDADTLSITFTKRNSTEKETIVTKKDEAGKWKIEKAPDGVTINPTDGLVYIPSKQVQPKTWVDTQTKHKNKQSKIVRVMPNILDLEEFVGTTEWIDETGSALKSSEKGIHEKGIFTGYEWKESILEGNVIKHIFKKVSTPVKPTPENPTRPTPEIPGKITPEKPSKAETPVVRTVWRDENGKDLKVPSVDKQEAGEIEGYDFVESHREGDDLTVHVFRTKQAQTPSPEQTPSPAPSKVSEQKGEAVATATSEKTVDSATYTKTSDKAELPNTGTEANASLASAGIMTLLAGLGLGFFKKKEDEK